MYKILFIPTTTFVKLWAPKRMPQNELNIFEIWAIENPENIVGLLLNPIVQKSLHHWPGSIEFRAKYIETCEIFIDELTRRFNDITIEPDLFLTESLERQYYEIVKII